MDLLHQVLKAVDRNGDGKIQYEGMHNSEARSGGGGGSEEAVVMD